MSRHGIDEARAKLKERLRDSVERVQRKPPPPPPELFTKDATCGSCAHRGEEVIGPSCKRPLGLYHCKLRPHYDWQSPSASCRFEPSRYERKG